MQSVDYLIRELRLAPHPEGGFFRETYRSEERIPGNRLPRRYAGDRAFSSAIYYLIPGGQFSAFHRLKSDEVWHFYDGTVLALYLIDGLGNLEIRRLGQGSGDDLQVVVPAHTWFAARCLDAHGHCLAGCTVSPGFDFADFEMGRRSDLIAQFPQHEGLITDMTRG